MKVSITEERRINSDLNTFLAYSILRKVNSKSGQYFQTCPFDLIRWICETFFECKTIQYKCQEDILKCILKKIAVKAIRKNVSLHLLI